MESLLQYSDLTCEQLKTILKFRGLTVSGKKADLINRLNKHDQQCIDEKYEFDAPRYYCNLRQLDEQIEQESAQNKMKMFPSSNLIND